MIEEDDGLSRVYFFEHVESGLIKIGYTTKPLVQRARQIMSEDTVLVAGRNKRRREWLEEGDGEVGLGCNGRVHVSAGQHLSALRPLQRHICSPIEEES